MPMDCSCPTPMKVVSVKTFVVSADMNFISYIERTMMVCCCDVISYNHVDKYKQ